MINVTKTGCRLLQNDITYPADRRGSPAMRINPGETDTIYDLCYLRITSVSSGWAKSVVLVTDVFGIIQCIPKCRLWVITSKKLR